MAATADAPFRDRTVVVQGATGTVGNEVVRLLAAQGARLAIPVRRPWQVERVRQRLDAMGVPAGGMLVATTADAEAAAGFVKGAEDSLGPIAACVSAAGAFAAGPFLAESTAATAALWEANFGAVARLVRAVVPPMQRRRSGGVAVTGARLAAAGQAVAGMATYLATKAALHVWAGCLAAELAPAGVTVRVVAPGIVDTAANRAAMPDADASAWLPPHTVAERLCAAAAGAGEPLQVL